MGECIRAPRTIDVMHRTSFPHSPTYSVRPRGNRSEVAFSLVRKDGTELGADRRMEMDFSDRRDDFVAWISERVMYCQIDGKDNGNMVQRHLLLPMRGLVERRKGGQQPGRWLGTSL